MTRKPGDLPLPSLLIPARGVLDRGNFRAGDMSRAAWIARGGSMPVRAPSLPLSDPVCAETEPTAPCAGFGPVGHACQAPPGPARD